MSAAMRTGPGSIEDARGYFCDWSNPRACTSGRIHPACGLIPSMFFLGAKGCIAPHYTRRA